MGYAGTAAEVSFSYAPDGSSWTLVDSHGRTQRLYFRDDPTGHYPRLVDRLELTAFAGATAIYRFAYSVGAVARPCADIQGGQETVPLLTSLIDPMGRELTFGYYTGGAGCESSGRLKQAELDAGGYQRWWYGDYPFPPFDCAGTTPTYFTAVAGVVQKALIKPDGSVLGTWSYQPSLTGGPGCSATERRTTVTTPLGHAETHYFSVATSSAATAGGAADYGLPLTRSADDGHARYLSVSKAGRETYVRFEQDRTCASMLDDCFDTNRRLASQRVLYTDDPVAGGGYRFADTDSADPADAGYRTYRNYEFGALAREGFLDSEGAALPFRHADFDVDPGTGLLAARRVPWARRLCRSTFVCTK